MSSSYFLKRMAAGVWPAAVALVIALAHIPEFLHRLLDGDEAIYGTIAVLMNAGGSLYGAGGVDNKPPGIFWVYSLTFRMFGDYQMTAVHAAGFLAMAATCFLLFMITRDLAGRRAGLLAALFYGILTAAGNHKREALLPELRAAGSLAYAQRRAEAFASRALADLECLPASAGRAILETLADRVVHRDH